MLMLWSLPHERRYNFFLGLMVFLELHAIIALRSVVMEQTAKVDFSSWSSRIVQ